MIAEEAEIEARPEPTVDPDGYLVMPDGEIVGHVNDRDRLVIDDHDKADWALELRSRIEADIAATDIRIRGVLAQLEAVKAAHLRRLSWWEWRFAPDLIVYARSLLKGKSRTTQFNWGRVSFRTVKGSTEILDPDAAVEFVKLYAPDRVKVRESVNVGDVLAVLPLAEAAGDEDKPNWLKTAEPAENVTISTGIEIKGAKG